MRPMTTGVAEAKTAAESAEHVALDAREEARSFDVTQMSGALSPELQTLAADLTSARAKLKC